MDKKGGIGMKNIKFRVWCKENEQFIQFNKMGFLEDGSLWYVQELDENEKEIDPPYFENKNDWELMQYTGLKDKNGVEIFEVDIVNHYWSDQIGESHCGKVVMRNPFDYSVEDAVYFIFADELEILGNIYENPELLEVTE